MRIQQSRYTSMYFGHTGAGRFDAPTGQYGVLYLAQDAFGAFVQTLGHQTGRRIVDWHEIEARSLASVTPNRPLHLVDLSGPGLARIGADNALASGLDYDLSRRWALALHVHPDQPDGLLYRSRHDPSRDCDAIFDRAAVDLTATSLGSLADASNAALLADLLDTYEYGLIV